jgi:hypothetical protein
MRSIAPIRIMVVGLLLAGAVQGTAKAQVNGPVVIRSEDSTVLQLWIVDPETGVAAFYGGDIIAICQNDPDGHNLTDLQTVYGPQELAEVFVQKGRNVGASLWDPAPPFVVPRLCQNILSRPGPVATGTADIVATGRWPTDWSDPDPKVQTVYGATARGTMRTPAGETLRVESHWRCRGWSTDTRCTEDVVVN